MIAGSIEKIEMSGDDIQFTIRRQTPLSPGMHDPFAAYRPYFPASMYSDKMSNVRDSVPLDDVVCHYARFNHTRGRCVVLSLATS
ncbi:unnamed protein product [Mycena citricolor]|uniref:Uncharacterized protein n=1 Tax=Mycena citricolor TaxID=2018698 RepID=A0AAD2H9R5_9AGAR|nr:unnamed protein product [Mycena citricolor]